MHGPPPDLGPQLAQANSALQDRGIALRLEQRGASLAIRGPLPPRHGSGPYRTQRLSLGLKASTSGMEEARSRVLQVQRQLQQGRFAWDDWGGRRTAGGAPASVQVSTAELILRFQAAFLAEPRRRYNPAGTRSTWATAYRPYLRRLQAMAAPGRPLEPGLLLQVLESYPQASRSRAQCGTALAALARHLGLELPADWQSLAGGYGLHRARFRQLPSDERIEATIARIPNPAWALAYGLMATYGLRNHEIFFCDLSALAPGGDRVLRVLPTSKTGEHQVWPFPPRWVDRFGLERLAAEPAALPAVCLDLNRTTLQQVGRRVGEQFRRYGLSHTPYDLRHAWAVRTIHIGLPDTVAARMMGHSVAIHTRTYHHWITRRDQQQAVDAALARSQGLTA
ncbi:site-specific integrase [Synechococcus sp. RSCCF101]|uniref:site-specific integrase n=1 Tax=Synechococcus sp. RSCCF101 TaxID=2511069 RepID=UPI00124605AA|nr:site-specific integrase [Synechococcus sp. RSCCF101]QEY31371.1 site-specific integrase [Synechococcus sp. RSCCF101]